MKTSEQGCKRPIVQGCKRPIVQGCKCPIVQGCRSGRLPRRVVVIATERVFDGFFKLDRATVSYERFDGSMSAPVSRLVFERGDSVGVLPFDRERRRVILVQQFRYPAYLRDGPGWLWEIIAGMIEPGRDAEDVARSEALEEAGYRLGELRQAMTVYASPGGSSERIHIYLAPVVSDQHVGNGGGFPKDGEDLLVRAFELNEALEMIEDGRVVDAKTVLALQFLALHWGKV
ncbi:MAG TPA: NUDIX domain-containing protein [Anaerolineae bacterium]|nr:NUDIX domain-containing protein [Anaerolineae bacterium]